MTEAIKADKKCANCGYYLQHTVSGLETYNLPPSRLVEVVREAFIGRCGNGDSSHYAHVIMGWHPACTKFE